MTATMTPDSWVRSAYSVFWSRPGGPQQEYQRLDRRPKPRQRRLRGWLPMAGAALTIALMILGSMGLLGQFRPSVTSEALQRDVAAQNPEASPGGEQQVKMTASPAATDGGSDSNSSPEDKAVAPVGAREPGPAPAGKMKRVLTSPSQNTRPDEVLVVLQPNAWSAEAAAAPDAPGTALPASGNALPPSGD